MSGPYPSRCHNDIRNVGLENRSAAGQVLARRCHDATHEVFEAFLSTRTLLRSSHRLKVNQPFDSHCGLLFFLCVLAAPPWLDAPAVRAVLVFSEFVLCAAEEGEAGFTGLVLAWFEGLALAAFVADGFLDPL